MYIKALEAHLVDVKKDVDDGKKEIERLKTELEQEKKRVFHLKSSYGVERNGKMRKLF